MGAGFSSLYREIHYIKVRYIKVWVYHKLLPDVIDKLIEYLQAENAIYYQRKKERQSVPVKNIR